MSARRDTPITVGMTTTTITTITIMATPMGMTIPTVPRIITPTITTTTTDPRHASHRRRAESPRHRAPSPLGHRDRLRPHPGERQARAPRDGERAHPRQRDLRRDRGRPPVARGVEAHARQAHARVRERRGVLAVR